MAKSKFQLNVAGLNELMKGSEMQAALTEAGNAVASAAGSGYGVRTHVADWTAITNVYPETDEAKNKNYNENSLVKALGAAGLRM